MAALIVDLLGGAVVAALGVVLIIGARGIVEAMRGISYPSREYRPERPIGWWALLPARWVGFTLICTGAAMMIWSLWHFAQVDTCLDAGGRWIESKLTCETN